MNKIKIISDTSCDFTKEEYKEFDVTPIPFSVSFDGVNYQKEIVEFEAEEMYNKMVENDKVFPKSSTPNPNDFLVEFTKAIENKQDIICMCITDKFSGSYQAAVLASNMLLDEYPDAKIVVINTMINTVGQGLFVKEVIKLRDSGETFENIVEWANNNKQTGRIFFTVGSLDYLAHGGRIGRLSCLIGKGLMIKPLIELKEGDIHNVGIAVGRTRSLAKVLDCVKNYFNKQKLNPEEFDFTVGYGYDKEEAINFKDRLVNEFKKVGFNIQASLARIGATIAVHTGPYALGVGLFKKSK